MQSVFYKLKKHFLSLLNEILSVRNDLDGWGLGMTFGIEKTYPRLGDWIEFVKPENIVDAAKVIILRQR